MNTAIGTQVALTLALYRCGESQQVTINSVGYDATVSVIPKRDLDSMMQGLTGLNAANPDFRRVQLTPTDFLSGYPAEESQLFIFEGGVSKPFTILSVTAEEVGAVDTAVNLVVYRTPETVEQMDLSTTGIAGAPKPMQPPVNPHA